MHLQQITNKNIAKLYSSRTRTEWLSVSNAHPYYTPAQLFANFSAELASEADQIFKQRAKINVTNLYLLEALLAAPNNIAITNVPAVGKEDLTTLASKDEIASEKTSNPEMELPTPLSSIESEPMVFEPLFASDYFASQGIKLSEVVQPNDKLGNQLKSFTQWLQTMKKIQNPTSQEGADMPDGAVQQLANKSNIENEIITEAMAVAYLQQNKTSKAIAVYEKLSLQYPDKSDYFATKIKGLSA